MKEQPQPCVSDEQLQIAIKLCEAVKKHPCIYDPDSEGYQIRGTVAKAWKTVAKNVSDSGKSDYLNYSTVHLSYKRKFKVNEDVNTRQWRVCLKQLGFC